ncbi:Ig-like domain-containing protein, partial [Brevibacillus sp. NRS-1366]|uniref:Ig-like domain-containing protein n=1 Tax=Brevibacillus sp. NRS-1366 TaxID=3233899 RepID=UPI003D20CE9E
AIDSTTVEVKFNNAVSEVLPSNFTVTQKDNGSRVYVKAAQLSEDKKSATVTLFDALTEGKAYTVDTAEIKDANGTTMAPDKDEFTYTLVAPASIEFSVSKLPAKADVDLDNYITVKDAKGNVLKSGFVAKFASNLPIADGNIVNLQDKTSITLNATIEGTELTTGNKVLATEAPAAATVDTFKLVDGASTPVEVKTLFLGTGGNETGLDADGKPSSGPSFTLAATFKDQFGDEFADANTTYESLTPTVLAVTASTGDIRPIAVGTAYVRATNGKATKTIQLDVKANPIATALEAADTLAVVGSSSSPAGKLALTIKDQYGNKVLTPSTVTVTSADETIAKPVSSSHTVIAGEANIEVQGLKAGSTKLTLTLGTLKKEVTVNATTAGTVNNYLIEATDDHIDLNPDAEDADATIKVYEVDGNGNKVKDLTTSGSIDTSLKFELPTDALIKAGGASNVFEKADTADKAGTTVVTVKAGTLTIGTATIKVLDTTDVVASRKLVNPLVKLNTKDLVTGYDLSELAKNIKVTTQSGKEVADVDSLIEEVVTSDASVIAVDSKTTVTAADDVNGAKKSATLTVIFNKEELAPVSFTVEVYDVTAPDAPEVTGDITTDSTTVTGTAEAGSTVTVKAGDTVLGTAVAAADGSYIVTIAKQVVDTEVTVTATDANKNVSDATTVTVIAAS